MNDEGVQHMANFLTDEWLEALETALSGHEGFTSAIGGVDLTLSFEVTDPPEDRLSAYTLTFDNGSVSVDSGGSDSADATIASTYETAVAISKGELNTQMAFMTGKIKIAGNMGKLLQHQRIMTDFANAAATVDVEY
ncbi:MAG TPA: SCP2 sterol-binding domain-containing protein [Acidimicrobiia bacterium]|nr:SCP2 sterol-binding domain-containing protein [Acidimicrobiia bacterium]